MRSRSPRKSPMASLALSLWCSPSRLTPLRAIIRRSAYQVLRSSSGNFAIFAAILLASSFVSNFAAVASSPRAPRFAIFQCCIRLVKIDQSGRNVMHAVIRNYSGKGAKKLIDIAEKNKAEVEKLMRPIKGFVSYSLVRTSKGGFSVTVCKDKAGTDESIVQH